MGLLQLLQTGLRCLCCGCSDDFGAPILMGLPGTAFKVCFLLSSREQGLLKQERLTQEDPSSISYCKGPTHNKPSQAAVTYS